MTSTLPVRRLAAALTTAALALGLALVMPGAAQAEGRVSITVADRPSLSGVADSTYLTEVRVSGTGYQSVQNGFGGMYVLFGWVDNGTWRPSAGGLTGSDYRYVYDDETNPVGYQLFVSFPGSSTGYANNGGYLAADGSWSAAMKIPGPVFQAYDRSGGISEVNCLQVQCGIITIGAHGVVNAANESFTPIEFQQIYSASDGKAVSSSVAAPSVAVAPTIIGGRPATIPTALAESEVLAAPDGGVTAAVGQSLLTVTVPGADPEQWLGVYLYSEPAFVGWFKPNSAGVLDVAIPDNLAAGDHHAVIMNTDGALLGWGGFAIAEAEVGADAPVVDAAPAADDLTPLITAVVIGGVLVVLALIALVIVVLRRRSVSAAS